MRRLLSLLLASTMILVACGNANNENKKKEDEKIRSEAKKNNDKPKNEKKNQDINKTIMSKFKMSIINNQS